MKVRAAKLDAERVKQVYAYHPDGYLVWARNGHRRKAGERAGYFRQGRWFARFERVEFTVARLILLICKDEWPENVDHIDCDKMNDKIENLRGCTTSQNLCNKRVSVRSAWGIKGVGPHRGGIRVSIRANGVKRTAKVKTIEEGKALYAKWSAELHGEFGRVA